jgi:hypothetical protein
MGSRDNVLIRGGRVDQHHNGGKDIHYLHII